MKYYFIINFTSIFFILSAISIFPHFSQTKKNLIWLVFIFICVSILMIIDFNIEFLPLAYLLIYVGAIAVMFLFIIVAVDAKSENRIEWFEPSLLPALIANNFLTSVLYFIFSRGSGSSFFDINNFLNFKESLKLHHALFKDNLLSNGVCAECQKDEIIKNFYADFTINSNCVYDNLSLYNLVEFRSKDIYIFSEYFFTSHGFLLIIVGFVLTAAMLIALLIAKDFSKKLNEV